MTRVCVVAAVTTLALAAALEPSGSQADLPIHRTQRIMPPARVTVRVVDLRDARAVGTVTPA